MRTITLPDVDAAHRLGIELSEIEEDLAFLHRDRSDLAYSVSVCGRARPGFGGEALRAAVVSALCKRSAEIRARLIEMGIYIDPNPDYLKLPPAL